MNNDEPVKSPWFGFFYICKLQFAVPPLLALQNMYHQSELLLYRTILQKSKKSFCYIGTGAADLSGNFPFGDIGPGKILSSTY